MQTLERIIGNHKWYTKLKSSDECSLVDCFAFVNKICKFVGVDFMAMYSKKWIYFSRFLSFFICTAIFINNPIALYHEKDDAVKLNLIIWWFLGAGVRFN